MSTQPPGQKTKNIREFVSEKIIHVNTDRLGQKLREAVHKAKIAVGIKEKGTIPETNADRRALQDTSRLYEDPQDTLKKGKQQNSIPTNGIGMNEKVYDTVQSRRPPAARQPSAMSQPSPDELRAPTPPPRTTVSQEDLYMTPVKLVTPEKGSRTERDGDGIYGTFTDPQTPPGTKPSSQNHATQPNPLEPPKDEPPQRPKTADSPKQASEAKRSATTAHDNTPAARTAAAANLAALQAPKTTATPPQPTKSTSTLQKQDSLKKPTVPTRV